MKIGGFPVFSICKKKWSEKRVLIYGINKKLVLTLGNFCRNLTLPAFISHLESLHSEQIWKKLPRSFCNNYKIIYNWSISSIWEKKWNKRLIIYGFHKKLVVNTEECLQKIWPCVSLQSGIVAFWANKKLSFLLISKWTIKLLVNVFNFRKEMGIKADTRKLVSSICWKEMKKGLIIYDTH